MLAGTTNIVLTFIAIALIDKIGRKPFSAQWLANFAISMTFPLLLSRVGLAGAYGFYTLSAFISIFFVWRFVTETRGKKLESM